MKTPVELELDSEWMRESTFIELQLRSVLSGRRGLIVSPATSGTMDGYTSGVGTTCNASSTRLIAL